MSYFMKRRGMSGMGDAVTDPSQVDPDVEIEMPPDYVGSGAIVGTVTPTFVSCDSLPDGSPWLDGTHCAKRTPTPDGVAAFKSFFNFDTTPTINPTTGAAGPPGMSNGTKLLLVGGLAAGAYYLFGRKKKGA